MHIEQQIETEGALVARDENQPPGLSRHLAYALPSGIGGMAGALVAYCTEASLAALFAALVAGVTAFIAVARWLDDEMALAADGSYKIVTGAAALPIFGFAWMPPWVMMGCMLCTAATFAAWAGTVTITSYSTAPDPDARTRIGAHAAAAVQGVLLFTVGAIGTPFAYAALATLALLPLGLHLYLVIVAEGRARTSRTISHVTPKAAVTASSRR